LDRKVQEVASKNTYQEKTLRLIALLTNSIAKPLQRSRPKMTGIAARAD